MNGQLSTCCNAPLLQDETGDKICVACGLIEDNYPPKEGETDGK